LEHREGGRKEPVPRNPLAGEVAHPQGENDGLQKRLRQAESIIEVLK